MTALNLDEQHALLKIVIERLERCKIPYMVAGAVAANSYTAARTTADLDVIINITENDIDKLIAAFEGDFYINSREAIQDSLQRKYPFNAIYLATAAKVDLVPVKPEPFEQIEFSRRRLVMIEGEKYWYITPEDYILYKLKTYVVSKSDRQLNDLKNVIATQAGNLDLVYLRLWATRLNLLQEFETLYDLCR